MTLAEGDPVTVELPIIDLPIIASYPRVGDLRLHSLAYAVTYQCPRCDARREGTLLADDGDHDLVCPRCYARQLADTIFPPRSRG